MRDVQQPQPCTALSPLALTLALAFGLPTGTASAQPMPAVAERTYDIPAGPLAPALNRFARQAGVSMALDANALAGLRTEGLQGRFSVDQGFAQLLRGTGHAIQKTSAGYILTASPSTATSAPAAVRTSAQARTAPSARSNAALPPAASGASAPGAPTTLDAVVVAASRSNVEARRSPQTVQIIDRLEIEAQLALSTNSSDVLSNLIPSYTPSRGKMNGSGETLRGRTPLILVDGVPQSNPIRPTGREAHTIDFSMVDRIEVVQGANAINGLGATGGTINLITRRPEDGSLRQTLDVQATVPAGHGGSEGRDDGLSYKGTYSLSGRARQWDYLLSLSGEHQGLWRDAQGRSIGADNTQGDLMDSRSYDALGKLAYWFDDDQRLQATVNRYRITSRANYTPVAGNRATGLPTTSVPATPPGMPPFNDVWTSSLSYTHANLAGLELSALLFSQEFEGLFGADKSNTFQDPLIAPPGTLYDQSRALSSKLGSKVTLTKAGLLDGRAKLTGGFDTLTDEGKQDLHGTGRTYVPDSRYRSFSLFLQGEFKPLAAVTLHAGIRRENAKLHVDSYQTLAAYNRVNVQGGTLDFGETLYNAGIVVEATKDWNVYASYSEGFGMPDVGRVLRSINTPGQDVEDMKSLRPIVTKSVELGTRYQRGAWEADLSAYRSTSDYGTRVVRVDDAFMLAREKNRVQGVEAALAWRVTGEHKLRLAYSRSEGRYDSNADGSLDAQLDGLNIAPDRLIAQWTARWTPALSSFFQVQHAYSRDFGDAARRFSGYTLADLSLQLRLPRGTVRLAAANLFNRDYITYYSQSALVEPLRYFAGRGRTLTLGYSLEF